MVTIRKLTSAYMGSQHFTPVQVGVLARIAYLGARRAKKSGTQPILRLNLLTPRVLSSALFSSTSDRRPHARLLRFLIFIIRQPEVEIPVIE